MRCDHVVVFNQAPYRTFYEWGIQRRHTNPYSDARIKAIITVSSNALKYLSSMQLNIPIYRLHYFVDPTLFAYTPYEHKKNQLALMTRRNFDDIEQVMQLLYLRSAKNHLNNYKVKFIHSSTERQVASVLRQSKFFLHFGYQEGFGIPVLEAMLCGCVVVGYTGFGGDELYSPARAKKVYTLNVLDYVRAIEDLFTADMHAPALVAKLGTNAHRFAVKNYTQEKYQRELKIIWESIISQF